MCMKINKLKLALYVAIPLIVGGVASLLTGNAMEQFSKLQQPPLAPPGWLFPIVWSVLYILMGISSYLISEVDAPAEQKTRALIIYAVQLAVNFLWPIFFFYLEWYLFAFFWILLLWVLVAVMILEFSRISELAAELNVPYLIWLTFAGYLNLGIWLLI